MKMYTKAFGRSFTFSPQSKESPVSILVAGVDIPAKNYSKTIDSYIDSTTLQYSQFEYVTAGKGIVDLSGTTTEISAGDFFIIGKNVPRKLYSNPKEPLEKIYISAKGPFIESMLKDYHLDNQLNVIKVDVEQYFHAIIHKIEEAKSQTRELIDFIVCELLKIIQTAHHELNPASENTPKKIALDIAEYINANLHRKITLGELCRNFYMGETHLIEVFKAHYKTTPMNYVQRARMNNARYFIFNTDIEISKIAEMCGFTDYAYFAKVFKEHYGAPPRSYRKNKLYWLSMKNK